MAFISNGTTILDAGAFDVSLGSLEFISEATASASASIEFTSGIDSTYDIYYFEINSINTSGDNVGFEFNLSTNGGSTYAVTKTSTFHRAYHNEAGAGAILEYQGAHDLAQSTAYQDIITQAGSDADQASSGYLYLFQPSSSVYVKHYIGQMSTITYHDYNINNFFAGYGNTTNSIDAVRFQPDSGNFDGTIKMYGIKGS